ncbi:MAG: hypothetical protein BRD41_00410 [Bacteroidetes bacterium QS_1_63_11]|nr:MAG: hypothetical protein BRD41_00410 [Bacteroidetes bacterium QS_1_63_11]
MFEALKERKRLQDNAPHLEDNAPHLVRNLPFVVPSYKWWTEEEIKDKRTLYRKAGAEEIWVVDEDNQIHFYNDEEIGHSRTAPNCPTQL